MEKKGKEGRKGEKTGTRVIEVARFAALSSPPAWPGPADNESQYREGAALPSPRTANVFFLFFSGVYFPLSEK